MTLHRYMKKTKNFEPECAIGYGAAPQVQIIFSLDMEKDLAAHVKLLANHYHGLTQVK